tara:strand:+ start:657 stop:914 length:258 start_codon:yes stop_codon:yes gene_type:complete
MQLGYYLGRVTRGTAKAVLPVTKWAAQKATTFATDFGRGMVEQPTIITTGDEDRIDEEIRREFHEEESVQPELPGMNPQQPVRES